MADPVLKFPPEQKAAPATPSQPKAAEPRRRLMAGLRRYRRFLLLVVLPLVALVAGLTFYLNGGRYVSTDDAYVGAQKVLITPDISGKIEKVVVKEGQQVDPGDVLFEIDPVPFRLAVAQAKASLAQANVTYDNLIADLKIYGQMAELSQQGMDLKKRDVDRKSALVKNNFGSQLDLDNASTALVTASAQYQLLQQKIATAKAQLLGNPDLPLAEFPPYAQAKAALDQAQRNLDHTVMRAPMAGIATQVEQIQLGRFVMAGMRRCSASSTPPIPGSTPTRRNPISPMSRSASRSRSRSMPSPTMCSRARSARSRPAPARSLRSCRRRTRRAISSRWCSACRCGSISTRTTSSSAS